MKKFLSLITILLMSFISISQTTNIDKQVIIAPKDGYGRQFHQLISDNNLKVLQEFKELGWYLVEIPYNETQESFINKYKGSSSVKNIYKNEEMVYSNEFIPNDTQYPSQWFLKQISDADIDADLAWDSIPSNNAPVTVAVFDGGNDVTHEDLIGNIVTPFNAVTNAFSNGELVDPLYDRHGTACSGTIAAVTNNAKGVASVGNNKVKVMPINIMTYITSGGNFGTTTQIQINAINAAMGSNCVGISMSYSGTGYSQALNDAFIIAKNQGRSGKGLFICASTGNGYSSTVMPYPAAYSAVYGIGATSSTDARAAFSNYGNIVDISAPGAGILTTDLTGTNGYTTTNYASVSGTSFSCPITTAAGALLLYKNPTLTEAQVMTVLAQTADKVGNYVYTFNSAYPLSNRSIELGYGRINLSKAVNAVPLYGNPIDNPPVPQHNIVVYNCAVSNSTPNLGSTITINTTQKTNAPNLNAVNSKVQYRFSNDNIWSADDIIIGTDTSSLGNGIEFENETINFTIPATSTVGIKYILIRGNFDGVVSESTSIDNSCSVSIATVNPGAGGIDLQAFWMLNSLTTCGNNTSPSGGANGTSSFRFKNTGSVPISSFTSKVYWENCPWAGVPSSACNITAGNVNYVSNVAPLYNPILLTNQLTYTFTFTTCIANCGPISSRYDMLQIGETRNLVLEILTVNGQVGDSFESNNKAYLPITRTTCSTAIIGDAGDFYIGDENIEVEEAEPIVKVYTVTGMLVENADIKNLASGIYIIHTLQSDGSVSVRKIFK